MVPSSEGWQEFEFVVPDGVEAIDEVGISIEYFGRLKFLGRLFLADFTVSGPGHLEIDPKVETQEWGAISRFTWNRGHWTKQFGRIHGHAANDADIWTGHYYARDLVVSADIEPLAGASHMVTARVQGTGRFYAAGFENGEVVILRQDFGKTVLARAPFTPEPGQTYAIALEAHGTTLTFSVDGKALLTASDDTFAYGMSGLRLGQPGRMAISRFSVAEN